MLLLLIFCGAVVRSLMCLSFISSMFIERRDLSLGFRLCGGIGVLCHPYSFTVKNLLKWLYSAFDV